MRMMLILKLFKALESMILRNSCLEEICLSHNWISASVVHHLANKTRNMKKVQISTMKIRLLLTATESRKLWPCSCWGTEKELDKGFVRREYPEISPVEDENRPEEKKVLDSLRRLKKKLDFEDFALEVDEKLINRKILMDPLLFHDHLCRKGMFYDGNRLQDNCIWVPSLQ